MPSSHRLYYLTSCVVNYVLRREVQAWGLPLRRLREVGFRDSFSTIPGPDEQRSGLQQAPACFDGREAEKGGMVSRNLYEHEMRCSSCVCSLLLAHVKVLVQYSSAVV